MAHHKLMPPTGKMFIACSTGLDSMALLLFAEHLLERGLISSLIVVHVHHGTRPECDQEEEFLRNYCHKRQLTLHVKHLVGPSETNFEAWAREARYSFFKTLLQKGDYLATAHHLDDSFEWWLLQSLKTSNTEVLGIPLRRGDIIRPFLCVTKKQIETLALKNDLEFFTDSSNLDLRHERNYLRSEVVARMGIRFPKYLKHYVHRMNALVSEPRKKTFHHIIESKKYGIHVRFEVLPTIQELSSWLKKVSKKEKGSVRAELSKLLVSLESGGHGPMDFSGGVKIYFNRSELLLLHQDQIKNYLALDQKMLLQMQQVKQISSQTVAEALKLDLPFPRLIVTPDTGLPRMKSIHPLFPQFTAYLLENNLWFCSANQLKQLSLKRTELFARQISIINLHQTGEPA
ncbi:MAG: tRNA lysidine(34) synthetase TilS [Bacteriovoracaceae bacterium]